MKMLTMGMPLFAMQGEHPALALDQAMRLCGLGPLDLDGAEDNNDHVENALDGALSEAISEGRA